MYVKHELTIDEMDDFLWGPARENWINASDGERQAIWDMLEDVFYGQVPEDVAVNDVVAYDLDDILHSEDDEDEDYDESLKRTKLESRIKRLEKLILRK